MLAVLMSGSWRTGTSVADHNQKLLSELGLPFKFFIHTWDENIATFRNPLETVFAHRWYFALREPVFERFEPLLNKEYVLAHYPGSTVEVESFNAETLYSRFKFSNQQRKNLKYLNTCAMYYGMSQTHKLLRQDAKFNEFTHFLKIRPDFLLSRENLSQIFEYPIIFFGQSIEVDKVRVSDQCFSGKISDSLELMDAIIELEPKENDKILVFPDHIAISGENVLIEHIRNSQKLTSLPRHFIDELPPYNKIQRPKILENLEKPMYLWLLVASIHNIKVLLNRLIGYSQILLIKLFRPKGRG